MYIYFDGNYELLKISFDLDDFVRHIVYLYKINN